MTKQEYQQNLKERKGVFENIEVKLEDEISSYHDPLVLTISGGGYLDFNYHVPKGHKYIEIDELKKILMPEKLDI